MNGFLRLERLITHAAEGTNEAVLLPGASLAFVRTYYLIFYDTGTSPSNLTRTEWTVAEQIG